MNKRNFLYALSVAIIVANYVAEGMGYLGGNARTLVFFGAAAVAFWGYASPPPYLDEDENG